MDNMQKLCTMFYKNKSFLFSKCSTKLLYVIHVSVLSWILKILSQKIIVLFKFDIMLVC